MVKVDGTAERGGPEVGSLVHVGGLAVNQHGAQAGVVHERILNLTWLGGECWQCRLCT
jgi:hypothetical protein